MEKKIADLKAAYAAKDEAKLRKAAKAVVDYDFEHPFATSLIPGSVAVVNLAMKIVCAH